MKILIHLAGLACGLFMAGTALAAGSPEPYLSDGKALVRDGNFAAAEPILRKALEQAPEDPQAALYLGMALNRNGGGKEAESWLKQALRQDPENPNVNLELGVHYFNKEAFAEAQDYFETTITLAPTSDLAATARQYLEKMAVQKKEKAWLLTATAGFQYDSNVILLGGNLATPQGISHQSDYAGLFNLRALYTPVKREQWDITVGANAFRNVHGSLHDYDVTQGIVELAGHYAFTPKFSTALSYNYEYVLMGDDPFDSAHNVTPSLSYQSEKWGTTTVEYCYRDVSFRSSTRLPANSDRTGWNQSGTLSQLYPVSERLSVWGLYAHDEERSRQSFWDYSGNKGAIGMRLGLPLGLGADLSAKIHHREYETGNNGYPAIARIENEYAGTVLLWRKFGERWSVTLDETYTRNKSNMDSFDYTRWVTTLMVNARF
ncbi:tetratricopeptide repeat protein [Geomesophilobacter sediminis]|uniref:Tetratricopeptide repeat protein n=1 Tax=Geomesophilobacter sediminis TaxID=2798584 RepID=A0A8J7JCA7_9BACT|nr:tetratricopeptide repeat protein [Geomesophilobacter sediminis]MBJ6724956.1 tetratricopeptide repeat protein [Geomesophilobacter sediminis]